MTTNKDIYDVLINLVKKVKIVQSAIDSLTKQETTQMAVLDNLTAEVARQKTVDDSVLALINGIVAQLQALAKQSTVDPAALQALVDQIKANDDTLAAAVTANTPAPTTP